MIPKKWSNIESNFEKLVVAQSKENGPTAYYRSQTSSEELKNLVVWCAVSDKADSYEVNEEWIGIKRDGTLVWAYASGCSCWDGDYDFDEKKTIKQMTFAHDHAPEDWLKAINEFNKTLEIIQL